MRAQRIRIHGSGLAALATAKLLLARGAEVQVDAPRPGQTRILAIGADTLALTADIFNIPLPNLIIGPTVRQRRVDWSENDTGAMEQSALVCRADDFCALLLRQLQGAGAVMEPAVAPAAGDASDDDSDATWVISAGGRNTRAGIDAGQRVGYMARAIALPNEDSTSISATRQGWIFTAPHPQGGLALLIVAPQALAQPADAIADALAQSGRSLAGDGISEISKVAAIAPRFAFNLHGDRRIGVGEAVLCQDPLRGDGTGFSLRCALLAQAVVAAIAGGTDPAACFAHYRQRLRDVFIAHVRSCTEHYERARHRGIWAGEISAMRRAIVVTEAGATSAAYRFALAGADLVPIPPRSSLHGDRDNPERGEQGEDRDRDTHDFLAVG